MKYNQLTEGDRYMIVALKGNQGEFHDDIKLFLETHLITKFKSGLG
jgi:hypothetical protein